MSPYLCIGVQTCVVIWVLLFLYKTSLVDDLTDNNSTQPLPAVKSLQNPLGKGDALSAGAGHSFKDAAPEAKAAPQKKPEAKMENLMEGGQKWLQNLMSHEEKAQWNKLAHNHWPTLLGYYNISLEGRQVAPPAGRFCSWELK